LITFLNNLKNLDRYIKKLIMILVDSITVVFVLLFSFSLRLDYWYWPNDETVWVIFGAPLIAIPALYSFRLYQSIVRYIGLSALWSIFQAVTFYALAWGVLILTLNLEIDIPGISNSIPRSVIFINWMLTIITIGSIRVGAQFIFSDKQYSSGSKKTNVIIYGAGQSGRQLSHALQLSSEYKHVAYIDDNSNKNGEYINNIPVFSYNKIGSLIKKHNISEILLALPAISLRKKKEIIIKLKVFPVQVRSLPSVSKLAEGKVKINDLLEIDIGDLLGRSPVIPNEGLLKVKITGKVVLVTGAGGSIGSELCRQIISLKPKNLILFEANEPALYQIEQDLILLNTLGIKIFPVLGSVRDSKRMEYIFNYYKVQTIYHAAAYKHVPIVEFNPSQAVLNNSIGTMLAAEAAIAGNIETFVLISTDKAVRPSSTMGATKRIAELVLQALAKQKHNTCLTMVRFGNVLDSSGSVIPLFRKQIRDGGPITVTDINMVRYFMTIPEAVELVIQAGAMGTGGDVFVLDMGEPMKIYDLAVKMINLSGLQLLDNHNPDGDIEIKCTGIRPGEKLYEELLVGKDATKTENKLIMRANEEMIEWDKLKLTLSMLNKASINNDLEMIQKLIREIIPGFKSKL